MGNEIENLQTVLQKDPSNFQARRELAILLANEGFNEEALSNIQYLIKYFPEDAELQYNLAILYEKLKDLKEAKKAYQKAIQISPQEDFYYNLGEVLVSLEEWDEAIDCFRKVLSTDNNDGNCYFNLGLCYYHKDETNLAIDSFQQAVNLNPKDIFAYFYLGYIYQNNGLTNFAIENYKKVLSISPDYSWAYFNLASIAYKNGNLEEAKEYLLKTIEFNKNDIEAYKLLTKIFIKENDFEEIISILETRLDEEENGDLSYILAQVYKIIGQKEDYIDNLKDALENKLTLTFSQDKVMKELDSIEYRNLDVEEVEEYHSDYYEDEESDEQDFDDDIYSEDEDINEDDEILSDEDSDIEDEEI